MVRVEVGFLGRVRGTGWGWVGAGWFVWFWGLTVVFEKGGLTVGVGKGKILVVAFLIFRVYSVDE